MRDIYSPDLLLTASDLARSEALRGQVIAMIVDAAHCTMVSDDIHSLRRVAQRLGVTHDAISDDPPWESVAEVLHKRLQEIIAEDED